MRPLVVVDNPERWSLPANGVELVSANAYLTDAERFARSRVQVFNLCRSYRYQSSGYYVSLLGEARKHRPMPSVATIQDLKAAEIVRIMSDDLDALIHQSLRPIKTDRFELSCYFGRNLAERHNRLAARLFGLFEAPLMRAKFRRDGDVWRLIGMRAVAGRDIPESHNDAVVSAMSDYFTRRRSRSIRRRPPRYDLAILVDPDEPEPPSDKGTLNKFARAARALNVATTLITKADYARLAEFDALFIRATTNVHHYTYRFARRAAAQGMTVFDDPDSILRCTNKVFLAELLDRNHVKAPPTMVVHAGNVGEVSDRLGLPCVLKEPDSAFSQGVCKVSSSEELAVQASRMFGSSELIVAQAFSPTEFDWRVGVFLGVPLYACRYYMAPHHWQITKTSKTGGRRYGRVEAVPLSDAPKRVISTALRAANLIGRGLYGVDLKQIGRDVIVIEVNDNPSIHSRDEDGAEGDALYQTVMQGFVDELDGMRQRVPA